MWACSGSGSQLQASCDAIQNIDSYRYSISLSLQAEAFQQPEEASPNPLSEFAEALTGLFSDMRLEGSFVAPDRNQALLQFQDEELEVRTIGNESWIRVGATWQEQEPPGEDVIPSAASICEDQVERLVPCLDPASGEQELVNGIETIHYRLDKADLRGMPECLGRSGEEALPREFDVDIWLERNDGWPVRFEVISSDVDEEGKPISLELFMELSDIDDPTIEIEPPPVSPAPT